MEGPITNKINTIEKEHNIDVLFAVESGSRAWGFESPDSDYDVRFVYKRPLKDYLSLENPKDALNFKLDENLIDMSGWDIKKTLQLFQKNNPSLLEWINSPIIYKDGKLKDELLELSKQHFSPKKTALHYLSMAKKNFNENQEEVKTKKYFYVLRSLFAIEWILKHNSFPPLLFTEVLRDIEIPKNVKNEISILLEKKKKEGEIKKGPKNEVLHSYIVNQIKEYESKIPNIAETPEIPTEILDAIFRQQILTKN